MNLLVKKFISQEDIYDAPNEPFTEDFLSYEIDSNPAYFPLTRDQFKNDVKKAQLILSDPIHTIQINDSTISNKLIALLEILKEYETDPEFCSMIFVQKRTTALILQLFLDNCKYKFIKAGFLIGHGTSHIYKNSSNKDSKGRSCAERSSTMKTTDQRKCINDFKSGVLNTLVSTRVGEEGLDIQPCMLIIRYDPAITLINYIQSRGRARHATSRYITLCEKNCSIENFKVQVLKDEEIDMKNAIREEGDITETHGQTMPMEKEDVFTVESTGAQCTIHTAIQYLYKFCAHLPK